jgi:hypothetical protein
LVLRLADVPAITDVARARSDPELAVLSAVAHGGDSDVDKVALIAAAACEAAVNLDGERSTLYFDLVPASLSEAARRELQTMDPAKYEYQSEFARPYVAQGQLEGRVDLLVRQLTLRFGAVNDEALARIRSASIDELDTIGERLLAAESVEEAQGGH